MAVIFDEITGTVEPPTPPPPADEPGTAQAPSPAEDEESLRRLLRHLARREARLRAD